MQFFPQGSIHNGRGEFINAPSRASVENDRPHKPYVPNWSDILPPPPPIEPPPLPHPNGSSSHITGISGSTPQSPIFSTKPIRQYKPNVS